jgi:PTH1 family peptidyl-tRNA hydrolase
MFILVGLGNPGKEYENTRHNTGAMALEVFRKSQNFPEWKFDKKLSALTSNGKLKTYNVKLLQPQTFMNKSGDALKNLPLTTHNLQQGKKKIKEIANLAVLHDDLDIPFGSYKISFNKSSGGHRGVESIIKAVKTQAFARVRIGIAASAAVVKKSQDDETVEKVILGKFTPDQLAELKKMLKHIAEGLYCLITESREKAMSQYHA